MSTVNLLMARTKNSWWTLKFWHRTIGVISALFVMLLVITGLLLNHTWGLKLDRQYVQASALLDLYNIGPPTEPRGFELGEQWVSHVGERLYVDRTQLPESADALIGAVKLGEFVVIAVPNHIFLVDPQGLLIGKLGNADGVPAGMRGIGISANGDLVIRAAHGDYIADLDKMDWHDSSSPNVTWAHEAPIPNDLRQGLIEAYRGVGLPLERVILDLHSGRIFGKWGVYLIDSMAVLFLILAMSGVWMWLHRSP